MSDLEDQIALVALKEKLEQEIRTREGSKDNKLWDHITSLNTALGAALTPGTYLDDKTVRQDIATIRKGGKKILGVARTATGTACFNIIKEPGFEVVERNVTITGSGPLIPRPETARDLFGHTRKTDLTGKAYLTGEPAVTEDTQTTESPFVTGSHAARLPDGTLPRKTLLGTGDDDSPPEPPVRPQRGKSGVSPKYHVSAPATRDKVR